MTMIANVSRAGTLGPDQTGPGAGGGCLATAIAGRGHHTNIPL